jgi:hypothetical protein
MATLTVICEVSTTCFRTMAWPVGSRLFTSIFFLFHLPSKKGCDFHYTKTSFIHRFLNLSVPINIFKLYLSVPINRFNLYLSVLKLTNIKLYSLIWVRNRRIYGLFGLILTRHIYSSVGRVTDEYTCHIFISDVAPPTNIWGTCLSLQVCLYSSVNRHI